MNTKMFALAATLISLISTNAFADSSERNFGAQASAAACIAAVNTPDDPSDGPNHYQAIANGSATGVIGLVQGKSLIPGKGIVTIAEVVFENGQCATR